MLGNTELQGILLSSRITNLSFLKHDHGVSASRKLMEKTSLKHTHAAKLSSGQRSVAESKQFSDSLPLSLKDPEKYLAIF